MVAAMRTAIGLSLVFAVAGCSKAHRPKKGFAAQEVQCKRSGVELSETFETSWVDRDGVQWVRYRVGVSCTKPKTAETVPMDVWQECAFRNDAWDCEAWQSGPSGRGPQENVDSSIYLEPTERGRIEE